MITLFSMSKHVFFSYQVNCPLDPKKVYKCISSQAIGRMQIKKSSWKDSKFYWATYSLYHSKCIDLIGCFEIDTMPLGLIQRMLVILNNTVEGCYLECQRNISWGQNKPMNFVIKVTLQIILMYVNLDNKIPQIKKIDTCWNDQNLE